MSFPVSININISCFAACPDTHSERLSGLQLLSPHTLLACSESSGDILTIDTRVGKQPTQSSKIITPTATDRWSFCTTCDDMEEVGGLDAVRVVRMSDSGTVWVHEGRSLQACLHQQDLSSSLTGTKSAQHKRPCVQVSQSEASFVQSTRTKRFLKTI